MSVDCPLSCEYLREAHKHEKPPAIDAGALPNRDVVLSEEALEENEEFLEYLAEALGRAATRNSAVRDSDIREALDASVRTHRTLQTGLVYESLPANPLAADLCQALGTAIAEFQRQEAERLGIHKTRESTTLGLLVFLQHLELSYNNGRPRGRAFLDALLNFYSVEAETGGDSATSPLILP